MKAITLCFILFLAITNMSEGQPMPHVNPFLKPFNTPFEVPPFDKIDTSDFIPAYIEGMKQQMAEIEAIINSMPLPNNIGMEQQESEIGTVVSTNQVPDFKNTILPFDKSGLLLTRVKKVFNNLNEANTSDALQAIARYLNPLMTKHVDDIYLNEKLFERIKSVYNNRFNMNLDAQQIRVTEKYYRDFERRGANLSPEKKEQLRKINAELSMLSLTFSENLLAENKNFKLVIDKKKDLDGLPPSVIDGAAEAAKNLKMDGRWVFTLAKPSWIPFLQYSNKRDLREKIYRAWFMRGNNGNKYDNKEIVSKIAKARVQQAQLLGYPSFAAYVIDENMAKTPENVDEFLMKLWDASLPVAKKELVEMQNMIDKEGGQFKLASWDWWYYAEKLRKEKYDLDENELKPYFTLANVRDGMFMVANKLYGITFEKRSDIPVYQKDVEAFEVKEANGSHLGILYLDYFPRDGKRGGAWCTDFQSASWRNGQKVNPVISMVCNVTRPTADAPSLLSWDETTTLFHEFGHALHGLFTEGKYDRTAGVVPQDYVELPSQIMENWAGEPLVLKSYAKHYKTGKIIPEQLIKKIVNSGLFNQGFVTVEYLAASILDMDYHELNTPSDLEVEKFEQEAMNRIGLINEIIPRYRSTYFAHIFGGEYAAGYYVYIWAAVLDADAFNVFKESGDIFNKEIAAKFRKYCLSESGEDEGMVQYKKFRGQEPSIDPLLKRRGLQ